MQWPAAQLMYFPVHTIPSNTRRLHHHFSDEAADSDEDFHPMELRRSLMTLRRCDKIKVIEFTDPDQLTACRLSQLTDRHLRMMCFLMSPTLCVKTASELGVTTMAGFKRMMSAHAIDNSLMSRLVKQDLSNLAELAHEAGWTETFGVPDFNCEISRVPRGKKRRYVKAVPAQSQQSTSGSQVVPVQRDDSGGSVRRRLRSKSAPPAWTTS